jgi:hypothetical protein
MEESAEGVSSRDVGLRWMGRVKLIGARVMYKRLCIYKCDYACDEYIFPPVQG